MKKYQAYTVGKDGHFEKSELLECVDDEKAIHVAMKLVDDNDVELWQGARKIALLKR